MNTNIGQCLEQYTIAYPQEVLLVTAQIEGQTDRIAIFKGFSSSLMRATAFDPDIPVLPDEAEILSIDRVASPYNADDPQYIERGLTWETMQPQLDRAGIRVWDR